PCSNSLLSSSFRSVQEKDKPATAHTITRYIFNVFMIPAFYSEKLRPSRNVLADGKGRYSIPSEGIPLEAPSVLTSGSKPLYPVKTNRFCPVSDTFTFLTPPRLPTL